MIRRSSLVAALVVLSFLLTGLVSASVINTRNQEREALRHVMKSAIEQVVYKRYQPLSVEIERLDEKELYWMAVWHEIVNPKERDLSKALHRYCGILFAGIDRLNKPICSKSVDIGSGETRGLVEPVTRMLMLSERTGVLTSPYDQ